jgi:4-amino-4-deoxy-L-arabinose transferase-like glycosyltransferase
MKKEEIGKRVKNWLNQPQNMLLVAIVVLAFIFRIYFYVQTMSQPLWWDEACYGSLAKNLISHMWDGTSGIVGESAIRPLFFPFLWSVLLRLGSSEQMVRIVLELIPSLLSVLFIYLVGKELYGKMTGIISAGIFSVLWIQIFYSNRLMVHSIEVALVLISIYFFLVSIKSEFNPVKLSLSIFLLSLATLTRYTTGMIFFVFIILFFVDRKATLLKKANFWGFAILGVSPLLIFFLVNLIRTGNIFPALLGGNYLNPTQSAPFAFSFLNYIPLYLQTVFFVFFIVGICLALFELVAGYNLISKNKKLQAHIFLFILLIIVCSFFVFYMKGGEDRYLLPAVASVVCFAAFGLFSIANFLKRYHSYLPVLFILIILVIGGYSQIKFTDSLINNKKDSYLQIKQSFEWIRLNSLSNSTILGSGIYPYAIYYAERNYEELPENISSSDFFSIKADYLILHGFAPQPPYLGEYMQNQTKWQTLKVFYIDPAQTQPILIIYNQSA